MNVETIMNQENEKIRCGKVGRPFGVKGQFTIFWYSGTCPLTPGDATIYLERTNGEQKAYQLLQSRSKGERDIVTLKEVNAREEAAALTGCEVYVQNSDLPELAEGEYYAYQLVGLNVETDTGKKLGKVKSVFSTGANDVYEVLAEDASPGSEVLIPATEEVILEIDVNEQKILIHELEGLLD